MPSDLTGLPCPACQSGKLVLQTRTDDSDFDLGGKTVHVHIENVPYHQCDNCKEELIGPEAVRMQHEAVCRAAGYLLPAEYRDIRERFGWSQQKLADLTGYGIATVSRAERGRLLPNLNYDIVLRALRDCREYRENLERQLAVRTQTETLPEASRVKPAVNGVNKLVKISVPVPKSGFSFVAGSRGESNRIGLGI